MSLATLIGIIFAILAGAFVLAAVVFLFSTIFGLTFKALTGIFTVIGMVFTNIFNFIGSTVTDLLRLVGSILAALMFAPLTILAIVVGRWSRSKHLASAFSFECHSAMSCIYRLFIGNPARLLGLSKALEGVEKRVPEAMAAAPTSDKPNKKRVGVFEGYTIVGSLKSGGSGGKLYIADPNEIKQASFTKRGIDADQVVIKVFSLHDGSSMPQIVRESRALDAARKLGLVLEHELTADRFFYVMRYVPGESLSAVTKRMHSLSPREGLDDTQLKHTIGYADDLLTILDTYHRSGLWHKDVKPDNIIIDGKHGDAKAHLVDFGLVTPLRSAMTLTTHGTEYFRDPELVRQALRGVKVHQIDGSKFDVYAAGAVLYSMIENSFPAHSGLSQITKRCPDALRWIVRRSMAEYDRRYPSSAAMLADLRVVMTAPDPFKVKPADLPSVKVGDDVSPMPIPEPMPEYGAAPAQRVGAPAGSPVPPATDGRRVGRPNVNLVGWWSGKYAVTGGAQPGKTSGAKGGSKGKKGFVATAGIDKDGMFARVERDPSPEPLSRIVPADQRKSAQDQVRDARQRAMSMRSRASARRGSVRNKRKEYKNTPGAGVIFAGLLGLAVIFGGIVVVGSLLVGESFYGTPNTPVPPMFPSAESPVAFPAPEDLPMVHASMLVVSDLGDMVTPELQAGLALLNDRGLHTLGDLSGHSSATDIIHLAEYRNAIGAVPSDSDTLVIRTREWIAGHENIDSVMLLTTQPESSDPIYILVTEVFHTSQEIGVDSVSTILTLFKNNGFAAFAD
jgi:serine/threonine protein kinase